MPAARRKTKVSKKAEAQDSGSFVDRIRAKYADSICWIGDVVDPDTEGKVRTVSSGFLGLDLILNGGFRVGRVVEIYGPENIGKSILCMQLVKHLVDAGDRFGGYVDLEHSVDDNLEFYKAIGVPVDRVIFAQPSTAEVGLNMCRDFCNCGDNAVVVLDSVGELNPQSVLDGNAEDKHMAPVPRLLSAALPGIVIGAKRSDTVVIFVNQIREDLKSQYNEWRTPGGRKLKHTFCHRLAMKMVQRIRTADGVVIGHRVELKAIKSKVGPTYKTCQLDLMYDPRHNLWGFSREGDLIDTGRMLNVLQVSGAQHAFGEVVISKQGREQAKMVLKANKDLFNACYQAVRQEVQNYCNEARGNTNVQS